MSQKRKYNPIISKAKEWPVVRLSKHRKAFIQEVVKTSIENISALIKGEKNLREEIEKTLYREILRIHKKPWKVDPPDETTFWSHVKAELVASSDKPGEDKLLYGILKEIVKRYANEIAGSFRRSHYRLTRAIVTYGFARLLNAARLGGIRYLFSTRYKLKDKIQITGAIEQLRKLAQIGTIVMVPTHFSHLDSVLIGWVIHTLGLPPFIYGAGLNLFNMRAFAYFMNSLGAYKVDRRKKNLFYLETLKAYSSLALQKNCHSLFYPGGTRSRSGALESNLKLGLLGTAIEAQRINYQKYAKDAPKIFVVPVVFNYHFVLEAPTLIRDYLAAEGQERFYTEQDEYSKSYKIIKFLFKFFTKGSDISVSIGKAIDLFGNAVDDEGNSYSQDGRLIDTRDYFLTHGKIVGSRQREEEYTRIVSKAVVKAYYTISCVFASHLVAFTAFELMRRQHAELDFYNLFRLTEADLVLPYATFKNSFKKLRARIMQLHSEEKVNVAAHLEKGSLEDMITHGLNNVGMYHAKRPLIRNKQGDITTQDLSTLFYYHNRLMGYGLEKYIE